MSLMVPLLRRTGVCRSFLCVLWLYLYCLALRRWYCAWGQLEWSSIGYFCDDEDGREDIEAEDVAVELNTAPSPTSLRMFNRLFVYEWLPDGPLRWIPSNVWPVPYLSFLRPEEHFRSCLATTILSPYSDLSVSSFKWRLASSESSDLRRAGSDHLPPYHIWVFFPL